MCSGGRRSGGQDLSAHLVHDKRLPGRVHSDRVRQLLGECDGGRQAGEPGPVGHGRPGGLRSPQASLLPADRHISHLLQHRESDLVRERARQVVPGGEPPLSADAYHTSRHQARSAGRQGDD